MSDVDPIFSGLSDVNLEIRMPISGWGGVSSVELTILGVSVHSYNMYKKGEFHFDLITTRNFIS